MFDYLSAVFDEFWSKVDFDVAAFRDSLKFEWSQKFNSGFIPSQPRNGYSNAKCKMEKKSTNALTLRSNNCYFFK